MPTIIASLIQETASSKAVVYATTAAFNSKAATLLTTDTGNTVKNKKLFAFVTKVIQGLAQEEAKFAAYQILSQDPAYFTNANDSQTIASQLDTFNFNGLTIWEVLAGVTILD